MARVTARDIRKAFGSNTIIERLNLEIADEEFMVLVGPSGCGKSTLLRMIAGLEEITAGEIEIGGHVVNDLPPKNRDIAMVFQNYALYPHMSVRQNLEFGLRMRKTPKEERRRRVDEAAEILGLGELMDRKPRQLSGGQRQRVAVGRAIVRKPAVFLFDEPLSNLDAKLRMQMRAELTKLQKRLATTTIYVTHDQVEAMTMGDRIAVMNEGEIHQVGTPLELYDTPADVFVAAFIGTPPMSFFEARVVGNGAGLDAGAFTVPVPEALSTPLGARAGDAVRVGIRPERVTEWRDGSEGSAATGRRFRVEARVDVVEPLGHEVIVYAQAGPHALTAKLDPHRVPSAGADIDLGVDVEHLHLFDASSGRRIDGG